MILMILKLLWRVLLNKYNDIWWYDILVLICNIIIDMCNENTIYINAMYYVILL